MPSTADKYTINNITNFEGNEYKYPTFNNDDYEISALF